MRIEIWDGVTPFKLADGKARSMEEVANEFPFTTDPEAKIVLEYIGVNRVGAIDELFTLRDVYRIDPALNDAEALQEIIKIRTTLPEAQPMPGSIADDFILGLMEGMEIEHKINKGTGQANRQTDEAVRIGSRNQFCV